MIWHIILTIFGVFKLWRSFVGLLIGIGIIIGVIGVIVHCHGRGDDDDRLLGEKFPSLIIPRLFSFAFGYILHF